MRQITATELARWRLEATALPAAEQPLLLDVREPWEVERASIDGTLAIPMRQIPNALAQLSTDRTTVCICHHGGRSMQVALYLESRGFTDVVNLAGGIHAWSEQVDASVPQY